MLRFVVARATGKQKRGCESGNQAFGRGHARIVGRVKPAVRCFDIRTVGALMAGCPALLPPHSYAAFASSFSDCMSITKRYFTSLFNMRSYALLISRI